MTFTRLVLCGMIVSAMASAYADDNDAQHQAEKRAEMNKQRANATAQAAASSQGAGMHFMHLPPRTQPNPAPQNVVQNSAPQNMQPRQPPIQNAPVGFNRPNNPVNAAPVSPDRFQGSNPSQGSQNSGSRWNHDSDPQRGSHNQGFNNQGVNNPGINNNVRFNNNVANFNNGVNFNNNTQSNSRGSNRDPRFSQDWGSHYRMPYRQGSSGAYRVYYTRSWPSNYGWRVHGWRQDYRSVDPYWFAVITSMALAQAWSDAEVAQAINDNNLRQQLIYDAGVRQQMLDSGYPADQVDYPENDGYGSSYSNDQGASSDYYEGQDQYSQSQYPTQYGQGQVATQTTQSSYYPPPNQPAPSGMSPSSPLYTADQGAAMPSGEQVANLNANKNALFFCSAGNKQSTALALQSITHPDMNIWKTMDAYNRCAMWASTP